MAGQTRQISAIVFNAPGKVSIGKFELPARLITLLLRLYIHSFRRVPSFAFYQAVMVPMKKCPLFQVIPGWERLLRSVQK